MKFRTQDQATADRCKQALLDGTLVDQMMLAEEGPVMVTAMFSRCQGTGKQSHGAGRSSFCRRSRIAKLASAKSVIPRLVPVFVIRICSGSSSANLWASFTGTVARKRPPSSRSNSMPTQPEPGDEYESLTTLRLTCSMCVTPYLFVGTRESRLMPSLVAVSSRWRRVW